MRKSLHTTLCVCIILVIHASQSRADWQVWTTTETTRVLRDAPAGESSAVELAAAGNEWESFQILMRSDAPIGGIQVEAVDLKGPPGAVIRASDARLFRQHQLELTVGTYRNDKFKPGWYPDPLIPFNNPLTRKPLREARLRAIPFDLPARQTHGFWVDIYVPPGTSPGEYRGAYRVTAGDGQVVEVPVSLKVWDFALSPTPTLQTALGSPAQRMKAYYRQRAKDGKEKEPDDWTAVETQCAELLARHRINATPPRGSIVPVLQPDGSYRISSQQVDRLREFIDRYHVAAVPVVSPKYIVKDPEKQRDKLRAWLKSWDLAAQELNRPHVVFYTYLKDEPNDEEAYQFVRNWGRAIREADSVVKVMVVEQTSPQKEGQWGDLYGAVDIWCPLFPLFQPASAAKRQALGETIWSYTALCQSEPTPWWHIDYPLLNYRVPAWISWRYRIGGLLYWGGMSHWRGVDDPWTEPETYRGKGSFQLGKKGKVYNGEGTLVYPARAVGYDGIAPSLRLKALRDSIEDYEYLAILQRAGLSDEAEQVILPLAGSWFQWEKDPTAYEKARSKLAAMIEGISNSKGKELSTNCFPKISRRALARGSLGNRTLTRSG